MAPGCTSEASVGRAATSDSGSLDSGSLDSGSLDSGSLDTGSLVADAAPPLDAVEYAKMVLIISAHMEIADPQVARLSKDTRALLGGIWAARARSEMGAGSGFERVPMPAHRGAEDPIRAALHGIGLGSSRVLSVAACQFDVTAS